MQGSAQLAAQACRLWVCVLYYTVRAVVQAPLYALRNVLLPPSQPTSPHVGFYEGTVTHDRKLPKRHRFRYAVRTAYISLDSPPWWFAQQQGDHMTAQQAREFASTDGTVHLLTNPIAAGYTINPISVYYCKSGPAQELDKCIVEVTNTPWGERVTFVMPGDGRRHSVRKALHVSPLMDMDATWHLELPAPDHTLKLVVRCEHPTLGNFFYADQVGIRCEGRGSGARNEEAGLRTFLRYGLLPHRIACWIYWHALVLLWKGMTLHSPPPFSTLQRAADGASHPPIASLGCPFAWRPAPGGWPWDTWGLGGSAAGGGGAGGGAGGRVAGGEGGAKAEVFAGGGKGKGL